MSAALSKEVARRITNTVTFAAEMPSFEIFDASQLVMVSAAD